jgi:putative restriction endonuclease
VVETEDWQARVASIRRWSRGGERAPHKPLLLLYTLGRLQRTGTSKVTYTEAEPTLARLLAEFGSPRPSTPAYPFHHLQGDGLWTVEAGGEEPGSSPTRLRETGATGELTREFERALHDDPSLIVLIARFLLDENFPATAHDDLCEVVGLDLGALEVDAARIRARSLRRRDPTFRERVLVAYEYRCAMCGFDGRLGAESVALDAAHIRWWAFDGPDAIENSLCLCSFHHKLLDRGVIGVTADHRVAVSMHFVGRGSTAERMVLDLVEAPLLAPQAGQPLPDDGHVAWHGTEVFRGPARENA